MRGLLEIAASAPAAFSSGFAVWATHVQCARLFGTYIFLSHVKGGIDRICHFYEKVDFRLKGDRNRPEREVG